MYYDRVLSLTEGLNGFHNLTDVQLMERDEGRNIPS